MKYFKVVRGYGKDDFIPIDETELDKALMAHVTGKVVVLKNGSITGTNISEIIPDWSRAEKVYNPTGDDILLDKTRNEYLDALADSRSRIERVAKGLPPAPREETKKIENPVIVRHGAQSLGEALKRLEEGKK